MSRVGAPLGNKYRLGKESKSTFKAIVHPTIQDIYFAAGVWFGEGTCGQTRHGSAMANVDQVDPWITCWMIERFGGSKKAHHHKLVSGNGINHRWTVYGARARGFLMTIYKLMSPKRKTQIRKALGLEDSP